MTAQAKTIKIYGERGPNPTKVAMLLKELQIPYEAIPLSLKEVKQPEYLTVNPNGRMPAIYDPNTDLTLWESGAIIQYLIERYDKQRKLSFEPGTNEAYLTNQWLFFQVTGQGPYYGQAIWFQKHHSEPLPSAQERYAKEIARVTSVLEGHLKKQKEKYRDESGDGPWLVGNRITYADIAFVSWQWIVSRIDGFAFDKKLFNADDYHEVNEWLDRMYARPAIRQVVEEQVKGRY
jgi:glutathione S-transferase